MILELFTYNSPRGILIFQYVNHQALNLATMTEAYLDGLKGCLLGGKVSIKISTTNKLGPKYLQISAFICQGK